MNERIKQLRKSLNLTQEEFAQRLGVKRNTVATYELGRSKPSDAVISLISKQFNISGEWLRTGKGEMHTLVEDDLSTYMADIAVGDDEFIKNFIKTYMELDEISKEVIRRLLGKTENEQNKREQ